MEEKKIIITIAREFGSGGRIVGKKLAQDLGIEYYDRALLRLAAQEMGMDMQALENLDEKASSPLLYSLSVGAYPGYTPMIPPVFFQPTSEDLFAMQAKVINKLAAERSCVIVGRCADYILRDNPDCIRILLYANKEARRQRLAQIYGIPPSEVSDEIKRLDRSRKKYYKFYTGQEWGDVHNYNLALDTDAVDLDAVTGMIEEYARLYAAKA